MKYQEINAETIDRWVSSGWEWGIPISHEGFLNAKNGSRDMYLTPTKTVPHAWFPQDLKGKRVLGLASGGAQQMPIFAALGAECYVLDYSERQCESERIKAEEEGYQIEIFRRDMTQPLPFEDESFDIIFHPVSNSYIEHVEPVFRECYRILKKGGIMMCGLDTGINYIFDETETTLKYPLPFNPLKDAALMEMLQQGDDGVQFSHTLEEQIGGQLQAGFVLTHLFEDVNGTGKLHAFNIPTFIATRAIKP